MTRLFLSSWIVLHAATASMAGQAPVQSIPDVATLEELAKLEPQRLADGWEVRLGLGESGAEAGPWRLLYCHAKHVGRHKAPTLAHDGEIFGQTLGPVLYRVEAAKGTPRMFGKTAMRAGMPAEGIFCGIVLTAWKGLYGLRVLSRDGKVIARRDIEVDEPRPCYWQQFARSVGRLVKKGEAAYAARRKGFAARPGYGGLTSLWPSVGRRAKLLSQREGTPLPGMIPLGQAWDALLGGVGPRSVKIGEVAHPLKLSLEDDVFVIRAGIKLVDWPDLRLLARWWVNDEPIVPPRSATVELIQLGRLVGHTREIKVAAGWPDHLGDLKVGDKLGLQVLYSPGLIQQIRQRRTRGELLHAVALQEPGVARVPLLSHRIDFTITNELLRVRADGS